MKVKIMQWHAVASWTWDAQDETCGIVEWPLMDVAQIVNSPAMIAP